MNVKVKIKPVNDESSLSKSSYYYLTVKTYKDTFEGKFERSELRHLIEVIDNGIGI